MAKAPTLWKSASQVNQTDEIEPQFQPDIIAGPDGGFYVIWVDDSDTFKTGPVIMARKYDAEGNPLTDEQVVSTLPDGLQNKPSVAILSNGKLAIAYVDAFNDPNDNPDLGEDLNIRVDILNADLSFFRTDNVAETTDSDADDPAITAVAGGGYIVSYTQGAGADTDVIARVIGPGGPDGFTTDTVIHDDDGIVENSETATLANGRVVVVYQDEHSCDANLNIAFKIREANGNPVVSEVVAATADDETDPDIAALTGGGFVIAWTKEAGDGDGTGILATVYNAAGVPQVGSIDIPVNTDTTGDQEKAKVTGLADGGFLVVWQDLGTDTIEAQRFDSGGGKVGDQFTIANETVLDNDEPAVALLDDGRIAIVVSTPASNPETRVSIWDPRESTINGTDGNDVITSRKDGATVKGKDGNDTLLGQNKKDKLKGDDGKDTLFGRKGNDKLTGGKDNDTFVFDTKLNKKKNVDEITDFKANKDTIALEQDILKKIGKSLSKKEFEIGKKADDKKDRIIYDKKSGDLIYDKNGSKKGGATLFAELDKKLKLDHNDFDMI